MPVARAPGGPRPRGCCSWSAPRPRPPRRPRAGARRRRTGGGTASRVRRRASPRATPSGPSSRPSPSRPTCRPTPSPPAPPPARSTRSPPSASTSSWPTAPPSTGSSLRLEESDASGANVGADKAKVLACPATVPWGPGQNAAWRDRPVADCSLGSAEGVRAADGTWTFDLAAIGRLWADPFAPLPAYGVVLSVDPAASPSPVQVSWLNFETGKRRASNWRPRRPPPAPHADSGPFASDPAAADRRRPPPSRPSTPPPTAGPSPSTGGGAAAGPLDYPSRPGGRRGDAGRLRHRSHRSPAGVARRGDPGAAPDQPGPACSSARRAVDFWERVPAPTALLLPVALGLAFLVSVTLGPAGRPSPVFRREGGLSRALARRNPGAGRDAVPDRNSQGEFMTHRSAQVAVARGAAITLALLLAAACGQKAGVGTTARRRRRRRTRRGRRPGVPG